MPANSRWDLIRRLRVNYRRNYISYVSLPYFFNVMFNFILLLNSSYPTKRFMLGT